MDSGVLSEVVVQHGFAGLAAVLLVVLWWTVRRVLDLLAECNRVIAQNTAALQGLETRLLESVRLEIDLRDRLLARPCLLGRSDRRAAAALDPRVRHGLAAHLEPRGERSARADRPAPTDPQQKETER